MGRIFTSAAIVASTLLAPIIAAAQTPKALVGAWEQVSVNVERPDGSKFDPWGGKLRGLTIFSEDGHFAQQNTRTDVAKFASGNRQTATPEENRAAVQGSYAAFGTYSVNEADRTITVHIEGSSFPNEIGSTQVRKFTLNGDDLTYVNPAAPSGGGAVNVLKRAKGAH